MYRLEKWGDKWRILGNGKYREVNPNCEVCGEDLRNKLNHIDHIDNTQPKNDNIENLRLTCVKCNMANKKRKFRKSKYHLTITIDSDVIAAFRDYCTQNNVAVSSKIEVLVKEYLLDNP